MYLLHTKPANVSCFIQLTQSMLQQQLFTNQSIQIQLNHFNAKYITINYILVSIHLIWLFGASTSLLAFYLGPGVYIAKTWFSYFTYMHMYSVHSHMHTKLLPHNNVYIQHWCIHTYINTRNSTIFCHLLHFHRLQFFYLKLIEILCLPPSPLLVFTAKNLYQLNFCFSFFTFPPRLCVCVC